VETDLNLITGAVIDEALRLHRVLGPGLLESVYQKLLARRLERRGFVVERQKRVAFEYDQIRFEPGLRVDLLVNGLVIVELKSVKKLKPVYAKQLLTYLRLLDLRVGLLLNFGGETLKEGLRRVVNNYSAPQTFPRASA
jgi:GxxExxY protein